jgi:hypothetical protein
VVGEGFSRECSKVQVYVSFLNQALPPSSSIGEGMSQDDGGMEILERGREGWNEELIPDALDVDGNGWSSRFHRLMMSGSLVLKSTIYPEWNSVSHLLHRKS